MTAVPKTQHIQNADSRGEAGFSLVEVFIVCVIITILTTMAIFAMRPHRNLYQTDDQALQILNFMRDASQRAISQRQVMRVEIDTTANRIRIRDENRVGLIAPAADTDDDRVVREEPLVPQAVIRCDTNPTGITVPNANFPAAVFANSLHPAAGGNSMWQARFRSNGSVVNAGNDAAATGAAITSSTIFIWTPQAPNSTSTNNPQTVRAITVSGASGATRLWKYDGTAFVGS